MAKSRQNSRGQTISSLWIYGPWLDLVVGCGAWSAPLLLLSYVAPASSARTWAIAFYALALFFNYPHYMATIYRAYHRAEDFHKYRVFTVHITALVVLTLLLSHVWIRLLPWSFTIYLTWSPWHYSGQNYGLFMMFARRAGADPDKSTRRALYGAFVASYLILFLGFHTGGSSDPLFLSLGIPAIVGRWEQVILGAAFVGLSGYGLARLARATGWRKLTPSLTLFSSQFLWFLLPAAISLIKGVDIPQSRYSSGVLAVMHSAQYLWITSYYARRENSGEGARDKDRRKWRPLAYFAVLVVGGIALFVPGPWVASRAFHHDFTASFLIFTALVNIHHFILDGAIWKLRDGRIASLLLNSSSRISDAASEAGGRFAQTCRWVAGNTSGARRLRFSAAALLLALGTVDQMRYYLALHTENLGDLRRAATMNAFDGSLQMRLADQAMRDGQGGEAEAAWQRALRSNPADLAAQQGLLRFLIGQNRFDEAMKLTNSSLQYAPRDANLLVDHGLLELKSGHDDEARADWERAIAVDPSQSNAHLYLAMQLDRGGNAVMAAAHYTSYLESVTKQPVRNRPLPEQVIGIVLRLADCQSRSAQPETAIKTYRLAEKMAVQTRQPKFESVADVNEAVLQAKSGKSDEALQLYQHALQLDESVGDNSATGEDWFAYGRFLEDAGFPGRLAYACMVKGEGEFQKLPGAKFPDSLSAVRKNLEKRLGEKAAAIRRDPEPALKEALALKR